MRISNILVLLGGIFLLGVGIWTFQNKTFTNDLLRYLLFMFIPCRCVYQYFSPEVLEAILEQTHALDIRTVIASSNLPIFVQEQPVPWTQPLLTSLSVFRYSLYLDTASPNLSTCVQEQPLLGHSLS